jgi:hypothetical protein
MFNCNAATAKTGIARPLPAAAASAGYMGSEVTAIT